MVDGQAIYNKSLIKGIKEKPTFNEKLWNSSFSLIAGASGGISIQFTDVGIIIALIGVTIIKKASFYGYAWHKISKNNVWKEIIMFIMKGIMID